MINIVKKIQKELSSKHFVLYRTKNYIFYKKNLSKCPVFGRISFRLLGRTYGLVVQERRIVESALCSMY